MGKHTIKQIDITTIIGSIYHTGKDGLMDITDIIIGIYTS